MLRGKCFCTCNFTIRFYFLGSLLLFRLSLVSTLLRPIQCLLYLFSFKTLSDDLNIAAENLTREMGAMDPSILLAFIGVLNTDVFVKPDLWTPKNKPEFQSKVSELPPRPPSLSI